MINKRLIRENRGFTLIEILAVIVLISLIVIIAIPSVKSISTKSKRKLFNTKVKIVEEAVNLWGENNISCFETGCDVLSDCQEIENNTKKCKTTFGLLAKNNIINYDGEVDGVSYVVNPIDSSNMNDYEIFVFLNNNNNIITSELNKDSIKDPEIIDIISNKNNNNIGNDSDKDVNNKTTEDADKDGNNNTITITIDYNNGEITPITSVINGSIILDANKAKKDGYTFERWQITSGSESASVNGNSLTVYNSDVTVQAQYKPVEPVSFKSDTWAVIAANVRENKEATASVYSVGSEKEVLIGGTSYTVRIANNSNYDCTLDSKTACGFVVEFVDIITIHNMNPAGAYNGTNYPDGTNLGGWPSSSMYKYINGDTSDHLTYGGTNATLYSKLPIDLRSVVVDTAVISGHGSEDSNTFGTYGNWESIDKLYLLTIGEIFSNCLTRNCDDTASYQNGTIITRQLDYYNGVTTGTNYERAIKQRGGSSTSWWLRTAYSRSSHFFGYVSYASLYGWNFARDSLGVAPAFRIG